MGSFAADFAIPISVAPLVALVGGALVYWLGTTRHSRRTRRAGVAVMAVLPPALIATWLATVHTH
jgi:hypothetical protein